jgi:hypothetical protein
MYASASISQRIPVQLLTIQPARCWKLRTHPIVCNGRSAVTKAANTTSAKKKGDTGNAGKRPNILVIWGDDIGM